jgi:ribosomal subunit interface protein
MRLHISTHGIEISEAAREIFERRLRLGLGRFGGRITRVTMRLADTNGPRGGADKLVRIEARMPGSALLIEEQGDELFAAVSRAIERMARAVDRALARRVAARRIATA